jgi:hypothetical protein
MSKNKTRKLDLQMFNVTGGAIADSWSVVNYAGQLFTSDVTDFPITNMIGGLGGAVKSENFEFVVGQTYSHESAGQPSITETASLSAPNPIGYTRTQVKNVCQIFHEQVAVSYEKMANSGRLSGINTAGQQVQPVSEKDFQIAKAMEKISRDLEYTILLGSYALSNGVGVANTTRGLCEACTTKTNAGSATLSKVLIDTTLDAMFAAGARFKKPVFVANSFQIGKLNDIYGNAPMDWNIGGVRLSVVRTKYGDIGILPPHRFMTASILGIFDLANVRLVFQEVPGKGLLFYEELSKTGAAEKGQIFGKIGLDHGMTWDLGQIYGLATS